MQKENTNQIVKTIAKCLDVPLHDVNISTSNRMPLMSKNRPISNPIYRKQKSNSKSIRQHPPLIVRFSNRDKRNEIFKRKMMLINNEELNSVFGFRNITINENLTDYRCMLYDAAIETKRNWDYKFLWTNQGKIFLRQNSGSKIICVNFISDLTKLTSQSILPSQF